MAPSPPPPDHDVWWRYIPQPEQAERRRTIQRLRLLNRLRNRRVQIALLIGLYGLTCLIAFAAGLGSFALLALLPLLLAPPLAYLVYWLTWKEFNE